MRLLCRRWKGVTFPSQGTRGGGAFTTEDLAKEWQVGRPGYLGRERNFRFRRGRGVRGARGWAVEI
eukprot:scaffold83918_cov24-Tisochrysis_lutea.AAC.1